MQYIFNIQMTVVALFCSTMAALSRSVILAANISERKIMKPRAAVLNKELKMRFPYELKQGQSRIFHKLPSGLKMEVIFQPGLKNKDEDERKEKYVCNPLVFIHGSFHAAWCWAENWLPFFSHLGYDCYALSLLGQVILISSSLYEMWM